jgi:hypothetical protein
MKWREKKFVGTEAELIKKHNNQLQATKKKFDNVEKELTRLHE